MSKALLFLHTFDDAKYAVNVLGLPLDLIPRTARNGEQKVSVETPEELEPAFRKLCSINVSDEFTALRV